MKTYLKPEISVENLFSASTVAADPFDFSNNVGGGEAEISANDWWNLAD